MMEIVGLKNFVQDDVNNLIAKFVGVKHRKFVEEIDYLKRVYQGCYLWAHKIDEDYAMKYNEHYKQFHERTLIRYGNCQGCHKNKRNRGLYCNECKYSEKCIHCEITVMTNKDLYVLLPTDDVVCWECVMADQEEDIPLYNIALLNVINGESAGSCWRGDRFNEGGCVYCNAEEESNINSDSDSDSNNASNSDSE